MSKITILALLALAGCAHATMQVNPVPFSPNNLYLETTFWDLDFSSGQQIVKETHSGVWPSGTFDLSLEVRKTGLAICTLTTTWDDGWSSTATFQNSFTWGFIRVLGNTNFFTLAPTTIDDLCFSTKGRYSGTIYPYREEMIADGEFAFQMERIAASPATVPETGSSLLMLIGSFGALALRRSTAKA